MSNDAIEAADAPMADAEEAVTLRCGHEATTIYVCEAVRQADGTFVVTYHDGPPKTATMDASGTRWSLRGRLWVEAAACPRTDSSPQMIIVPRS